MIRRSIPCSQVENQNRSPYIGRLTSTAQLNNNNSLVRLLVLVTKSVSLSFYVDRFAVYLLNLTVKQRQRSSPLR